MAARLSMKIEERLDRLESLDEIRQLAAKYSVTLDMRDMDMHVNLFVPDVRVSKDKIGRQALKEWADATFRDQFIGTSHHIGNHIIDFNYPNSAIGLVYSKNEHETDSEWIIMQMLYWDTYIRVDGRWLFKKRLPMYWYASDINNPPLGDQKMRWPNQEPYDGFFHDLFPSWKEFWDSEYVRDNDVSEPVEANAFLKALRRGTEPGKIKVK